MEEHQYYHASKIHGDRMWAVSFTDEINWDNSYAVGLFYTEDYAVLVAKLLNEARRNDVHKT